MRGLCGDSGRAVVMMLFSGLVCWQLLEASRAARWHWQSSGHFEQFRPHAAFSLLLFPQVNLSWVGGVDVQRFACSACTIPPICQNLNAVSWDSSCKLREGS